MNTNDDTPLENSPAGDDVSAAAETTEAAPDQPVEDVAPPPAEPVEPAAASAPPTKRRGRPILGAIAGFLLGAFVWIDLVLFGVIPFDSVSVWFFPVLGLIVGIALAMWAPFGRRRAAT